MNKKVVEIELVEKILSWAAEQHIISDDAESWILNTIEEESQ